jgi:hypothetical protein
VDPILFRLADDLDLPPSRSAYVTNGKECIADMFGGNVTDRFNYPPSLVGDTVIAFSVL